MIRGRAGAEESAPLRDDPIAEEPGTKSPSEIASITAFLSLTKKERARAKTGRRVQAMMRTIHVVGGAFVSDPRDWPAEYSTVQVYLAGAGSGRGGKGEAQCANSIWCGGSAEPVK